VLQAAVLFFNFHSIISVRWLLYFIENSQVSLLLHPDIKIKQFLYLLSVKSYKKLIYSFFKCRYKYQLDSQANDLAKDI